MFPTIEYLPSPKDVWGLIQSFEKRFIPLLQTIGSVAINALMDFKQPRQLEARQMVTRYIDSSGVPRVTGGADLKASQAYPVQFLEKDSKPTKPPQGCDWYLFYIYIYLYIHYRSLT